MGSLTMRKRAPNASILFVLSCLVLMFSSTVHISANEPRTSAPPSSSNQYEWEDLNYYEILGLAGSPPSTASRKKRFKGRASISSSDVKRAYRKQAQLYHPDKQKTAKNQTMTVEERNARFAKIAEAYEILNDEHKRQEYDEFLLDCEDHLSGQQEETTSSSRWSSIFDDLSTDPRRVFEKFFFGTASSSESAWEDVRYNDSTRRNNKSSTPIRVYETREVHRDPYSGAEILRILQTEEFLTDTEGKLYYRVSGQDFVEEYDRFYGWNYVPVSQPFLVDEGYMQETQPKADSPTNTLSPGEYLFPESALLTSSSGQYYAGLSPNCELLIMTDAWDDAHVIWSSGTFVPHGGCFLGLRGPHLVLVLGSPERPGNLLWYSDVPESVVEEEERTLAMGGPPSLYVARLDDDGSLAVYRHETAPPPRGGASTDEETKWWHTIFSSQPSRPPRTRAAKAWTRVREWGRERILRQQQRSTTFPRETCVSATGPAGCNTHGRRLVHIAHGVGHSVKHTMNKIDNAIDTFVESIDEDEDLLDTVFRIANKATNGLLQAGQSLFRMQARLFHTLYRALMKRVHSSSRQS